MKKILWLLFLVFVISACSNAGALEVPIQLPTQTTINNQSYPGPIQAMPMEGYPGLGEIYWGTPAANVESPPLPEGQHPSAPFSASEPESGMGSISGTIYSFTTQVILPRTMFYLKPAVGPDNTNFPPTLFGPQEGSGDIVGRTDDKGQFFLNNVPPGNYFLIVEAPMNWAVGLEEDGDSAPRLITVEEGSKNPLGVVFISWP